MHSLEELLIGISGSSRYLQGYNRNKGVPVEAVAVK